MRPRDRSTARHRRGGHFARLDDEDETWLQGYMERTGLSAGQIIIRALRRERTKDENREPA